MSPARRVCSFSLTFAAAFLSTGYFVGEARASAPTLFGPGARSAAIARADISAGDPADAPSENAALAAEPGVRLRIGYGYAFMGGLSIDGQSAGVRDVSGVDLAAQIGFSVSSSVVVGGALAAHLPDASIATISFRPATEPQFILYESTLQRATFDIVAAIRYRSLSLGGGASMSVDVGGDGARVNIEQDASGPRAYAVADVALPYRAAPVFGARVDLGRLELGASFRGATAIDLSLPSESKVDLTDNPLNGTTTVKVTGTSGYDPATFDVGGSFSIGGGVTAHAALSVALYSAAPPPVADVTMDVRLGTVPSLREARFVEPRLRDTISPRVAFELRRPSGRASVPVSASASVSVPASVSESASVSEPASVPDWRWAVRVGYTLAPSPVPRQTGFTTYADAARHGISIGGGYHVGEVLGVDIAADLAAGVHVLAPRHEEKRSLSLPHAQFDVGGSMFHAAASLEAAWK